MGHFLHMFLILFAGGYIAGCAAEMRELDKIIDPGTRPVKLHTDDLFEFTEGPCHSEDGTLYFSDGIAGKVYRMDGFDRFTEIVSGAGRPDGMMVDYDGNLVVCDAYDKKLDLYSPEGTLIKTLADSYGGNVLNGPNDCVMDRKGGIYFTDPSFMNPNSPQGAEGVYYIPKDGEIQRVADGFGLPNGIILTPDEKTLLVVDYHFPEIRGFDVNADGTLSNDRVYATVKEKGPLPGETLRRNCIGVAMDYDGRLYAAMSFGMEVFDKDGKSLGILKFEEFDRFLNMTFDRKDPYTMIIATGKDLYSLKMKVKGISFPQYE